MQPLCRVGSTLHSSAVPSPFPFILKCLFESHAYNNNNFFFVFVFLILFFNPINHPLVSLRALVLVVFCLSMNCWGDDFPHENTDPTCNSPQYSEMFASGIFTQVTQVPLQRIKQCSTLMSDPTRSKPFGQKS